MCKKEKHQLKVVDAVKRFYQCHDCKTRTVTLFKIPREDSFPARSADRETTDELG
jgi:Mcm10 replication factor